MNKIVICGSLRYMNNMYRLAQKLGGRCGGSWDVTIPNRSLSTFEAQKKYIEYIVETDLVLILPKRINFTAANITQGNILHLHDGIHSINTNIRVVDENFATLDSVEIGESTLYALSIATFFKKKCFIVFDNNYVEAIYD